MKLHDQIDKKNGIAYAMIKMIRKIVSRYYSPDWLPPAICLISLVNPFAPNWHDKSCNVLGSPLSNSRSKKNNKVMFRANSYSIVSMSSKECVNITVRIYMYMVVVAHVCCNINRQLKTIYVCKNPPCRKTPNFIASNENRWGRIPFHGKTFFF